ncbi:hypothetical protein HK102_006089 [Quaeritorhiza haematococci]|nr:hypothetical protein HK102_006089 [Quaeritorhiza haematococci]
MAAKSHRQYNSTLLTIFLALSIFTVLTLPYDQDPTYEDANGCDCSIGSRRVLAQFRKPTFDSNEGPRQKNAQQIVTDATDAPEPYLEPLPAPYTNASLATGNQDNLVPSMVKAELLFWNDWLRTKGEILNNNKNDDSSGVLKGLMSRRVGGREEFDRRFDPTTPVIPSIAEYLGKVPKRYPPAGLPPEASGVAIMNVLNVGAGPVTGVGYRYDVGGVKTHIYAIDPNADIYIKLLNEYKLAPPVLTFKAHPETLQHIYPENFFDVTYVRDVLDYSVKAHVAYAKLIYVTAINGVIFSEHPKKHPKKHPKALYRRTEPNESATANPKPIARDASNLSHSLPSTHLSAPQPPIYRHRIVDGHFILEKLLGGSSNMVYDITRLLENEGIARIEVRETEEDIVVVMTKLRGITADYFG